MAGKGAGGEDMKDSLYGLMALAEEHQAAVGAAVAGLTAERAALAADRTVLAKQSKQMQDEIVRLRQAAEDLAPDVAKAAQKAVTQGLAGAGETAAAAVGQAVRPVLARLDQVTAQAAAAEAALRRVVGWVSWRLLWRGLAIVAAMAGLLWLSHLMVWKWAAWDVALAQTQKEMLLSEITGLQGKRAELEASRADLERQGVLAKMNRCGPGNRPCVRVLDASAAAPPEEGQLYELLVALIGRLDRQAEMLGRVEKGMGQIGIAVGKG